MQRRDPQPCFLLPVAGYPAASGSVVSRNPDAIFLGRFYVSPVPGHDLPIFIDMPGHPDFCLFCRPGMFPVAGNDDTGSFFYRFDPDKIRAGLWRPRMGTGKCNKKTEDHNTKQDNAF